VCQGCGVRHHQEWSCDRPGFAQSPSFGGLMKVTRKVTYFVMGAALG
jgi:hypothetical protein